MANKVLEIVIKAKDEATQTLNGLSASLKRNEKSFKTMAGVGTVAMAGITAVVAKSVNAYAESERSQRQLEHAIIGVSKGTKDQVKQVNELTEALQKKAGIDGDALNAGVAQLSTFGLQSKSVVDLTKSLADLTVNQKGVKASADDYISSANIMAKALNGEFGVLKKMGIRFTETQQKMIMYGTESQKVATIQEGLAQNLRETTDTVGGFDVMMGQLNGSIGEIQEAIGAGLQPVLLDLANVVVPIVRDIGDWIKANPELTATILIVAGAVTTAVTALGALGLILPMVIAGVGLLASPFVLVTASVVAFGVAIYNLNEIVKIFQNDSQLVLDGLKLYWQDFVNWIQELLATFGQYLIDEFEDAKTKVMIALDTLSQAFDPFTSKVEKAYNAVKRLVDKAKELGGDIKDSVGKVFGGGKAVGGAVQAGKTYLTGEKGPEMFTPSSNGVITPNYKMAGGGGVSLVINMNGGTYLDDTVAERIGDRIVQVFKRTARF